MTRCSPLLPLLFLLASGCWLGADELDRKLHDTGGDTEDLGPITITSVDPPFGTSAGGSVVKISAGPLSRSAVVRFGDAEATDVQVDGDRITATTPPGTVGLVTVTISSAGRTGTLVDGFEYFADASGQYGTIGSVAWYDYLRPLETIGYLDNGYGWMQFVEPEPYSYAALYGPSVDTCTREWGFPGNLVNVDTGIKSLSFTRSGGPGFALAWSETDGDFEGTLVAPSIPSVGNEYAPGETYDLQPFSATEPFPSFGLAGALITPAPFTVNQPTLGTGTPLINSGSFNLSWSTDETGDFMVARLFRWGDDGGEAVIKEEVRCLLTDDGNFTVPSVVWTAWESGYPIDIYVGRVRMSGLTLPHDASYHGLAGVYWVAGYGLQGLF